MDKLALCSALGLGGAQIISVYGAGGKTAVLNRLAAELSTAGFKTVLTTTTKIYPPRGIPLVLAEDAQQAALRLGRLLQKANTAALGCRMLPGEKLQGVEPGWMETLLQHTGAFLLVEADGAACKPVKGYRDTEPVIPEKSALIVAVTGLDALGARLVPEEVHRPELLAGSAGASPGTALNTAHLAEHLRYMIRIGREQAPGARIAAIFNKADLVPEAATAAQELATRLKGLQAERLLFTAAAKAAPVYFSYRPAGETFRPPVAAVVLAAGGSTRMGADKLQLQLRGRTILEHTLEHVCAAGLDQIVVVTRPGSPWRKIKVGGAPIRVIENPDWSSGMASSLKEGLQAVEGTMQAVCFALGDQPLVPAEAYRRLAEAYRQALPLAAVPAFRGRRGNPVIFDRRAWPLLLKLEGDTGGRQILARLPEEEVRLVELPFPEILQDVDTPGDYQKLLSLP